MTARRPKVRARFLRCRSAAGILGSAAHICRDRISDDGTPPKIEGAVSEMWERRRHLWERRPHLWEPHLR